MINNAINYIFDRITLRDAQAHHATESCRSGQLLSKLLNVNNTFYIKARVQYLINRVAMSVHHNTREITVTVNTITQRINEINSLSTSK